MALQKYTYRIEDLIPGLYAPSASVQVNKLDGTAATLYSANDTNSLTLTNPIIAALDGTFSFYAAALEYQYAITTVDGVLHTAQMPQNEYVVALTSTGGSIAIDLSLSNNFSHAMTESTTLANPTNAYAGVKAGQIAFTQNASSAYTLAFGSAWISTDGSTPAISTTLGAVNLLTYYVVDSTHVWFVLNTHGVA